MLRFIVRRLLLLVPILLGLSILVFAWIRALPGSPAESLLGERATPEIIKRTRHQYGLDRPIYVQYWRYLDETVHFDLGTSIATSRKITFEIKHPTNFYVLDAILARNPGAVWDTIKHLILPGIALGSIPLAIVARITRAAVLDVQNEDYVRTARAKGLAPLTVDRRHVLRNALLPVTTIVGLQTVLLLSGAVLTETVFAWPGVGFWLKEAIFNRDYPVLQGGILFLAVVFVLVNLIVDLSYAIINPRIRYG